MDLAECGREPRDSGRLEHRVRIHGQKQIAAGKPGRSVYCRAAPAPRAMTNNHVDQSQRPSPLRDSARLVDRAVIHDDDFDRPQGLPVQRRDRGAEPGAAVESRYDHADRSAACGHSIAWSAHAEKSQRKQRQRIARNVEYQHREGEQQQIGSGEQLHHFEHVTTLHPIRRRSRSPNANVADTAKEASPLQKLKIVTAPLSALSNDFGITLSVLGANQRISSNLRTPQCACGGCRILPDAMGSA